MVSGLVSFPTTSFPTLNEKASSAMMTPFDFILLLILSNTVQNAMNGGDNSLGGGLCLAGTLIAINWFMLLLSRHYRLVHWALVGRPVVPTS